MNEKEIAIEIYRYVASKFYDGSSQLDRPPIPYEKSIFVETVASGYRLLTEDTMLTLSEIKDYVLKNIETNLSEEKVMEQVEKIVKGEGLGKGPHWQWVNYCWTYIRTVNIERWNDFCVKVSKRDDKLRRRQPISFHDFIYLLLTIEYISMNKQH